MGAFVRAGLGAGAARRATIGLNAAILTPRLLRRELDYCNWLLRRR